MIAEAAPHRVAPRHYVDILATSDRPGSLPYKLANFDRIHLVKQSAAIFRTAQPELYLTTTNRGPSGTPNETGSMAQAFPGTKVEKLDRKQTQRRMARNFLCHHLPLVALKLAFR
jgi:hypothetical protein